MMPALELPVIGLGVALVADLGHYIGMAAGDVHQQLALVECAGQRLLYIDVLALVYCEHSHGEVGEVGNGDAHCVELAAELVEEFAEVGEDLCIGMLGYGLLALLAVGVNVAKGHELAESGGIEFGDNLTAAVGDADGCHLHFFGFGFGSRFFLLAGIHCFHCTEAGSGRQSAGCTYCADLYKLAS